MRLWTMLLSLMMLCVLAVNAPAQEQCKKHHSLADRFAKMDTNHDGILTLQEFVAARTKAGPAKAEAFYNKLTLLGGTTTKGSVTGMTLEQFRKAHKLLREQHAEKQPASH